MASLITLQTRALAAKGVVGQVVNLTSYPIRLKHVGTGSITSIIVTTATGVVIISDGYTQTYPFAAGLTLNTVGKLVNAINAGNCTEAAGGVLWEAKILDGLSTDTTTSNFVGAPTTLEAKTILSGGGVSEIVYDIAYNTTVAAPYVAYKLTFDRGFLKGHKKGHRVSLQEIQYFATLGAAAAGGLKVYEVNGTIETELWQGTPTSASAITKNWASGEGKITAGEGNDLLVYMAGNGTVATTVYLTVTGLIE